MNIAAKVQKNQNINDATLKNIDKQCREFLQDSKGKNNNLYNLL